MGTLPFGQEDFGNQVSGKDKKDIHANPALLKLPQVAKQDERNRDAAEAIKRWVSWHEERVSQELIEYELDR